jgi:hypothetical protein
MEYYGLAFPLYNIVENVYLPAVLNSSHLRTSVGSRVSSRLHPAAALVQRKTHDDAFRCSSPEA